MGPCAFIHAGGRAARAGERGGRERSAVRAARRMRGRPAGECAHSIASVAPRPRPVPVQSPPPPPPPQPPPRPQPAARSPHAAPARPLAPGWPASRTPPPPLLRPSARWQVSSRTAPAPSRTRPTAHVSRPAPHRTAPPTASAPTSIGGRCGSARAFPLSRNSGRMVPYHRAAARADTVRPTNCRNPAASSIVITRVVRVCVCV